MVEKKHLRLLCACCCCQTWYNYYSFLHNFVKTCDVCIDTFGSIPTTLWKVLFLLFMYCCGFQIIYCIFCIMGCVHCFREPCLKYQAAGNWQDAFHALVYESKCETEPKVREFLTKVFKK